MYFSEKIIFGEKVKNPKRILRKLKKNIPVDKIYIICYQKEDNNILEIFNSNEIFKEIHENKKYTAVGISNGKNESKDIVCEIVRDFLKTKNNIQNLKPYIMNKFSTGT